MRTHLTRGRRLAVTLAATAVVLLLVAAVAMAATPRVGVWVAKDTNPKQNQVSGKITFRIAKRGRLLAKFTIPDVSKYCAFIGVSAGPVYIPTAKIRRGHVKRRYNYGPKDFQAQYELTGHFTSAHAFRGEVKGTKTCVFDVKFLAHPR